MKYAIQVIDPNDRKHLVCMGGSMPATFTTRESADAAALRLSMADDVNRYQVVPVTE